MKLISDKEKYLRKQFETLRGYPINIAHPKTFNEKLQWLKLYYRNPLLTKCADKYAVRDYVTQKIGDKYLIPLVGVYDHETDIDFDKLPNKFIIKTNNNSGQNIICQDKNNLNINNTKNKLKELLLPQNNLYYFSYEWPYKNIKPKIVIEQLLEPNGDLIDYKFFCFNGQPKYVFAISERLTSKRIDCYDLDWKYVPIDKRSPHSDKGIIKPKNFTEMKKIAKILSQDFPFVRVDMYEVNGKIYIGELTFYPSAGMEILKPEKWNNIFGDLIKLPKSPNFFTKLLYRYL